THRKTMGFSAASRFHRLKPRCLPIQPTHKVPKTNRTATYIHIRRVLVSRFCLTHKAPATASEQKRQAHPPKDCVSANTQTDKSSTSTSMSFVQGLCKTIDQSGPMSPNKAEGLR